MKNLGIMVRVNALQVLVLEGQVGRSVLFVMNSAVVLGDEALKVATEEDSSLTYEKLNERFHVFDETVRLCLHLIGKTCKFTK